MDRQTLILLRGTTCVGKTQVRLKMEHRSLHLLDVPLLRDAATRGFAEFDDEGIAEIVAGSADPLGLVERTIGDKPYLLSDLWGGEGGNDIAVLKALGDKYRIVRVLVCALPWLVSARRSLRLAHLPDDDVNLANLHATTPPSLIDFYEGAGHEVVYVDTSDYPIRELTADEARAVLAPPDPPEIALADTDAQYQQALRVRGVWHGVTGPRQLWEWERINALLPADLTGKTVLDIGASEGGMTYEALHRGAIYATAVEIRAPQLAIMRHVRAAARLPMTVAHCDIFTHPPPPLRCHGTDLRRDLALLLNVLHHAPDPEPPLRAVLAACDSVVIETPSGTGHEPYKPGRGQYPNAWHLPWNWVKRQGEAAGFKLDSIEVGPYYPDDRLIFKLSRNEA